VRQFQRPGVVYRGVGGRVAAGVGTRCETSLVWRGDNGNPALARFVAYVQSHPDPGEPSVPNDRH
jgi:hypothetical protein